MGYSLATHTEVSMCCVPRASRHVTDYRSALLEWLQLLFTCLCQVCGHKWYAFFQFVPN